MRKLISKLLLTAVAVVGPLSAAKAETVDFNYSGAGQAFVVPENVGSILIEAWGAQGYSTGSQLGGTGGYTTGTLTVTGLQTLYIFVGGRGTEANVPNVLMGGGFNGGGDGVTWGGTGVAGGGGGASDVRTSTSLNDRLLVAGGGGGATGNGSNGGTGGGLIGGTAFVPAYYNGAWFGGTGGTQTTGGSLNGSFGLGGDAVIGQTGWVGGGGGGWYGGGASPAHMGGGGGSSYIGGVTGGSMVQGGRLGDGFLRLTFFATAVPEPSTWVMMLVGFGAIGASMRRRRRVSAIAQMA